eukprot:409997-Rhodomonas_salina.1
MNLQNRIATSMARDYISKMQGNRANTNSDSVQPANYKVGDKVLLGTEHYNFNSLAKNWPHTGSGPCRS